MCSSIEKPVKRALPRSEHELVPFAGKGSPPAVIEACNLRMSPTHSDIRSDAF
jgi:hypothetical protein